MFIAWGLSDDSSPQRVTCFGQLICDNEGLSKHLNSSTSEVKLCTKGHRDEHVTPLG
jgi:hypothetical protein